MSLPLLRELGARPDPALVGTKAAGLGVACSLGLRVPDGFVLPLGQVADPSQLAEALKALGERSGEALGDPDSPLILSIRATAPISLPGQLDTVLGFGATTAALPALQDRLGSREPALALVLQLRQAVLKLSGVAPRARADVAAAVTEGKDVAADVPTLIALIEQFRARAERHLPAPIGVIVQRMVFGSAKAPSGAIVGHSRHPVSGERGPRGEWTPGQLGEVLTGGRGTPAPLSAAERPRQRDASLEVIAPAVFAELRDVLTTLERHLRVPVEAELTLEAGTLHVLQVRPATLGPVAAVVAAVALCEEGVSTKREAIRQIDLDTLRRAGTSELGSPEELAAQGVVEVGRGLVASPGVASGRLYIHPDHVVAESRNGPVVLVRVDASPEDAPAVRAAVAVATSSGGLTSHAAVMSRALHRPCAVSVQGIRVEEAAGVVRADGRELRVGDWVTVDGNVGRLLAGRATARWTTRTQAARTLISWAREWGEGSDEPGDWYESIRAQSE